MILDLILDTRGNQIKIKTSTKINIIPILVATVQVNKVNHGGIFKFNAHCTVHSIKRINFQLRSVVLI